MENDVFDAGYYTLVHKVEGIDVSKVGKSFYLLEVSGDNVKVLRGTNSWHVDIETFREHFEFDPDGEVKRQGQLTELMADIYKMDRDQDHLIVRTGKVALAITDETKAISKQAIPSEETKTSTSKEVAINREQSIAATALQVKKMKSSIALMRMMVVRRQQAMQRIISEQKAILDHKLTALNKNIEIANEALYMLSAYLGTKGELVRIQNGERAPVDTKIHIRQSILFMDEEIAAADEWAKNNNFSIENLEDFDKWIKQPKYLKQILPEQKGIVALKVRRKDLNQREGGYDPKVTALNEANKNIYVLVRNGDLLYRICSNLKLENVLIPRPDDLSEYIARKNREQRWHQDDKEEMPKPGSEGYTKLMELADQERRRFYTALLMIQGILDRTKIFRPMPVDRINVCDPRTCSDFVEFIRDQENIITDGRPSFEEWIYDINSRLEPGMRVVGNYESSYYREGEKGQIRPKHSGRPNSGEVYTLDGKEDNHLFFRFKKNEYSWRSTTRRATYLFSPNRCNWLVGIDLATIEDMQYYVNSRLNRHEYRSMLPIMMSAIAFKKKEAKVEKNFRSLLVGELMKAHDITLDEAESKVDTLILWWKYKNKTHRALTSDDAKAIRMIVNEYKRRMDVADVSYTKAKACEFIKAYALMNRPELVSLFLRPDGDFNVYTGCNDENVFVNEEVWEYTSEGLFFKKLVTTITVDKRHESWHMLYSHERWTNWEIGNRGNRNLTPVDIEKMIEIAKAEWKNELPLDKLKEFGRSGTGKKRWGVPLVMTKEEMRITLFYAGTHNEIPTHETRLTGDYQYPTIGMISVRCTKEKNKSTYTEDHGSYSLDFWGYRRQDLKTFDAKVPWGNKDVEILERHDDNIASFREEWSQTHEFSWGRRDDDEIAEEVQRQVKKHLYKLWEAEKHKDFLEEYEDDEEQTLWMEYRKDLKSDFKMSGYFAYQATLYFIERSIDVNGYTVERLCKEAKKFGYSDRDDAEYKLCKELVLKVKNK